MIKIDGQPSQEQISNFNNLEELLTQIMKDEKMAGRVITDVLVNNENFSEIYPHQAEDMSCDQIQSVEIRSIAADKMALDISAELGKVARIMASGATNSARLFRESKDSEGLELLQDLLDVTRDFMGMLTHLKDRYLGGADEAFVSKTENFSDLISEMSEVLENEDWILLADLLEFEFTPMCEEWRKYGDQLHAQLENSMK